MRVALIEPSGRGGLAHYVYGLGNALARQGHHVVLLTALGHEAGCLPEAYQAVEVFDRFRTNPIRVVRTLLALGRQGIDIAHFHGAIHPEVYAPFLWLVRRLLRCPVVYTAHDLLPLKHPLARRAVGRLLTRPLTALVYHLSDVVVVHAANNRDLLLRLFSLRPDKVHVVPLGNYCFLETIAGGEAPPPTAGLKTVLFFGIIVESKGLLCLIRAFASVAARVPSSRLVVAGQPFQDCRPYLEEIERLGLGDRVQTDLRYIPMAEIPGYFQWADLVVLPYRDASQSAVLQVAYAFGRPVVASAVGGLAEAVEHRKSGILVPPDDEVALADAIVELLMHDALRVEMGCHARALATGRHSWEVVAAMTEMIYAGAT